MTRIKGLRLIAGEMGGGEGQVLTIVQLVVRICADFHQNCSFSVTSTVLSGYVDFNMVRSIRYGAK